MKYHKPIVRFLFLFLGFLSPYAQATLQVFACEPEWAALVKILGEDQVSVTTATTALQDPHQIEARPSLNAMARKADLLICTGAELEIGWLPMVLEKANNPNILPGKTGHFLATDHVTLLEIPKTIDRSAGDIHAQGNPHIQLDPRNYLPISQALAQTLAALDPAHKADYQNRFLHFKATWEENLARWETQAQPLRGLPVIVHHHHWLYLNHWLGLNQVATLEPKPGVLPRPTQLREVYNSVQHSPVAAILITPFESRQGAKWLSHKIHAPILTLPFTVGGTPEATDLTSLFEISLQALLTAHGERAHAG